MRLLVLYPHPHRFYPQYEVFGRLRGIDTLFAAPDAYYRERSRESMQFVEVSYKPISGAAGLGLGAIQQSSVRGLDRLIDQFEPGVIVSFETFSATSFQVARLKRHREEIRHVVLSDITTEPRRSLWSLAPSCAFYAAETVRSADLFVCHTELGRSALLIGGVSPDRVAIVPPGIPPSSATARGTIPTGACRILYLGALRPNKGIRTLVRSFQQLRASGVSATLTLAGGGPMLEELAQRQKSVAFELPGWVSEALKEDLMRRATLLVMPSQDDRVLGRVRWEEQTAIAAIEAMHRGLPVIGSDSGALPEIVGTPSAIFAQGSVVALTSMLQRASLEHGWLSRLGQTQELRAKLLFDIDLSARVLEAALLASGLN